MNTLNFIKDRHETAWGYQLPDGRIIDLLNENGKFYLSYDRSFSLQTGEVFPYGVHPKGSVTLNDLNKQGGQTVHCYDEVDLNFGTRFRIDEKKLNNIIERFAKKGFQVSKDAVLHQYNAWCHGFKSGYRDEENGYHLFTPCGGNPFSLRLTNLHEKCADWQTTYTC